MKILYEHKLTMKHIAETIQKEYGDLFCVYSPPSIGQFDIFVDTANINLPEDRVLYIDTENAKLIYLEEVVIPLLTDLHLCGIPDIENVFYQQDPKKSDEWMIETEGGSLKRLLCHPDTDTMRTTTNNVWDLYEVLGIEAAYTFLVEEFMSIMEDISIRHVQLLVEWMTYNGSINSISRYALRTEDIGPISRSSFEESFDNFVKAGVYGLEESTKGVSASIICGKLANVGSGVSKLHMAIPKEVETPIESPKGEDAVYSLKPALSKKLLQEQVKEQVKEKPVKKKTFSIPTLKSKK
jgi:DNA-directed RNA polymerase beta' subunit